MKYLATLEAIYSERDKYGNSYWAFRFIDHETGKVVEAITSGDESNIYGILRYTSHVGPDGWDRSIIWRVIEMQKRPFHKLTKHWLYAGCIPEEIVKFIKRVLSEDPRPVNTI